MMKMMIMKKQMNTSELLKHFVTHLTKQWKSLSDKSERYYKQRSPTSRKLPLWFTYSNAELLARTLYAFGRSCDRLPRSKFLLLFLVPRANAELKPKIHMTLYASHKTLHKTDIKFFTKTQPSPTQSKFSHKAELQTQNSARIPKFFPLLHIPSSPLPITLPSSPLGVLPYHQSNFTSTMSSHCLAVSRTANFSDSSLFLLFSSFFFRFTSVLEVFNFLFHAKV